MGQKRKIEKIKGTKRDDVLEGTAADEALYGRNGNDVLNGMGGHDWLYGGRGDDDLRGGDGNDVLNGGDGDDTLEGGSGYDALIGGSGTDTAVYSGDFADYGIARGYFGVTYVDHVPGGIGENNIDALYGIEQLQFDDALVFIDGRNNAPIARDDAFAINGDTGVRSFDLVANDLDPEGDAFAVTGIGGTAVGSTIDLLTSGGRTVTATITETGLAFGADSLSEMSDLLVGETDTLTAEYTVTDANGAASTATFSIEIDGAALPIVASNDEFDLSEEGLLDLLGNDQLSEGARITSINGESVAGGVDVRSEQDKFATLFVTPDGDVQFYYSANLDFIPVGFTDSLTFEYTIEDAAGRTSTASATVNIATVNDAPEVDDTPLFGIFENRTDTFLIFPGVDPEREAVTWTLTGDDAHLFEITADGDLSFIAAPDFEQPEDADGDNIYELTVTATDPHGLSDSGTVAVEILNQTGRNETIFSGGGSFAGTGEEDDLTVVATRDLTSLRLFGDGGDDVLKIDTNGEQGNNVRISGGLGNDRMTVVMSGGSVNPFSPRNEQIDLVGGPGDDTLIVSGEGNSSTRATLIGNEGDNVLRNDTEAGSQNVDLIGGTGDDWFFVGAGTNTLNDLADGFDTLSFANATTKGVLHGSEASAVFNLQNHRVNILNGIDRIEYSALDDRAVFTSTGRYQELAGMAGDDHLEVRDPNNMLLDGGDGDDFIASINGAGNTYIGGAGNDAIFMNSTGDTLIFGAGDGHDTVRGFDPDEDVFLTDGFVDQSFEVMDANGDGRVDDTRFTGITADGEVHLVDFLQLVATAEDFGF